jgi:hypothetical protein
MNAEQLVLAAGNDVTGLQPALGDQISATISAGNATIRLVNSIQTRSNNQGNATNFEAPPLIAANDPGTMTFLDLAQLVYARWNPAAGH